MVFFYPVQAAGTLKIARTSFWKEENIKENAIPQFTAMRLLLRVPPPSLLQIHICMQAEREKTWEKKKRRHH